MAVEEPEYRVIQTDGPIEIRDYEAMVVAETIVAAPFERAGNSAFRGLFNYISDNDISMTAPVTQEAADEGWAVRFIMPEGSALESLPKPTTSNVVLKPVPAQRVAVIRYSGTWSSDKYNDHLNNLESWVESNGFETIGEPVWARYNGPFTMWFLRRNEILLPIRQ
ncbi:MAG TPA: heme-binding protein [Xanthomonadales bacterium]|nr:heme-binding protein [Xanthomonadales bacterium]